MNPPPSALTAPVTKPSLFWTALSVASGVCEPLVAVFSGTLGQTLGLTAQPRWDSPRRRRRGVIFVLGGIEGPSLYLRAMCIGLLRSGWRGAVVPVRWNRGLPLLRAARNLMSRDHHERCAAELVERINAHRNAAPRTWIGLLAQSGGCWIVVRALERLGAARPIDRAALLAPAISPGYDPTAAACGTRKGVASIGGTGDLFFLGVGTTLFGTSDRHFGPSAGLLGWHRDAAGFHDLRWRPDWLRFGYSGNHITTCMPAFIRSVVAPWLCGRDA